MKRLPDETVALIGELHSAAKRFRRRADRESEQIRLIERVADSREAAAIYSLLTYLFDRSASVAAAACDAIDRLLRSMALEELPALDREARRWDYWDQPSAWHKLQSAGVDSLPKTVASRTSVLGLVSCHPNGHVRERAVRLLATTADEAALPFLLIRVNDWVANVRETARQGVEQRLHGGPPGVFLANLPLVIRLVSCRRDSYAGLVQEIVRRLAGSHLAVALARLIRHGPRELARPVFQLAVQLPGSHLRPMVEAASQSQDTALRLWAARCLPTVVAGQELEEALAVQARDRSMPVRRAALAVRLEALPATAPPALETSLLDPSPSIRELARFHLGQLGRGDFAAFYREALANARHQATAIAGLGETGKKDDALRIVPYLESPQARERQAAVRALSRLAGEEHSELLVSCLDDDSPKVTREVCEALQAQTDALDAKRLWAIFTHDSRRHVRLAALALLDAMPTWLRLPYLIRSAADADEAVARRGRVYIERRYNKVFTRPTEEEQRLIEAALVECAGSLDEAFLKELRSRLRWWEPG
jgi:HEAT repeat protein